jgi:hypothetical protein
MAKLKNRKIPWYDYLAIFIFPLIAFFITIYLKPPQIVSLLFFFILPSLYLSLRDPRIKGFFKKILIILAASIPFTIVIDYFAIRDGSWWVYTIFPIRILNGIPIEDFIWSAAWFYFIIIFYEYFIDQPPTAKDSPINKKYKNLLAFWYGLLVLLIFLLIIYKQITIPYFYSLFAIILGIIPLILIIHKNPKIISKFVRVVVYFFFVNILHEISALSANYWIFPGTNFIGWVELFGIFRFPFEEFFLWMILGAVYLLAWYELFVDDTK